MPVKLPIRALTFVAVAVSFWAMRDLVLGNVGVLLVLPLVIAWRWLDRPLGSIALAATISVRPSVGALLLWQLLRRRWRAAAWTIGAGIVLIVLTLPFVGIDGYRDYIAVLGNWSRRALARRIATLAPRPSRLGSTSAGSTSCAWAAWRLGPRSSC